MSLSLLILIISLHSAEFSLTSSNMSADPGPAPAPGPGPDQINRTLNETFSSDQGLAGVRSFIKEQEHESRIIGGQEAWAHSWPWQVSLCFASMPACGGAIISPMWVLSAAHCFKRYRKASYWTVQAGKHDLDNPHETGQQLVQVSLILSHPAYSPRSKDSDVSLLRLSEPLVFNAFIRPIPICSSPLPPHRKCTITGWGATRENGPRVNRLQEVNVTILPPADCNRYYHGRVRPSMFCAGREGGGVDACQGDSGGPLSCFTGGRYELAGLVSWGVGCGRAGRPGVYTKVLQHTEWISSVLSDNNLMFSDDFSSEEDQCGRQTSSCGTPPGLAYLSVSHHGQTSVGNVTESCPFFWPWMVSVQSNGRHYCSGTLVHQRWVLTARHCNVRAKEDIVVLGVHDLRFSSSQSIPVEEVVSPEDDGSFPPTSDLSLLRLGAPVRLASDVSPVCVPEEDEELDHSWTCLTASWGVTTATEGLDPDRLHHAGLSLVNQSSCSQMWGRGLISDSHICGHPAGSASCMGDRGAPLMCRKHGAYFLFGVVTWGSPQCDGDKPSIFTRVSDFQPWISDVTEDQ